MGQRELLILLGAIALFGVVALNVKRFLVDQDEAMLRRQIEFYAVSLAQSFIEEARVKVFDANATNPLSPDTKDFTNPAALGPEPGENYADFNDVDDYGGFSKTDSSGLGAFRVNIQVGYVNEANPNAVVNVKTFYKKMTVTVTHNLLKVPVNLSNVYGYRE